MNFFHGLFVLCLATLPTSALAQSLEWVAEHPGGTTPAMLISSSSLPAATTTLNTNDDVEAKVRARFTDAPVMVEVARCESRFRQFDSDGSPLDGGAGSMIGVFQINAPVHEKFAKSLGMDISTVDGNLAYARYLYDKSKTDPWISSIGCWNPLPAAESADAEIPAVLTANLSFGMIHSEVILLQKFLNTTDTPVALEGPGSPGEETTKFGSLTRAAVRNFQCKRSIVCDGDEHSTGYGFVGPRTREALLAATADHISLAPSPAPSQASTEQITGTPRLDQKAEITRLESIIAELSVQLFALTQKRP